LIEKRKKKKKVPVTESIVVEKTAANRPPSPEVKRVIQLRHGVRGKAAGQNSDHQPEPAVRAH